MREFPVVAPERALRGWVEYAARRLGGRAPEDPMPHGHSAGARGIVKRIRAYQSDLAALQSGDLPAGLAAPARSRAARGWTLGDAEEFLRDIQGLHVETSQIDRYIGGLDLGPAARSRLRKFMRRGNGLAIDSTGFIVALQKIRRAAGRGRD